MFNSGTWKSFKKEGLTKEGQSKNKREVATLNETIPIKNNMNHLKLAEPNISLSLKHLIEH